MVETETIWRVVATLQTATARDFLETARYSLETTTDSLQTARYSLETAMDLLDYRDCQIISGGCQRD